MKQVTMARIPQCDFTPCQQDATVDAKTTFGPWAYMCEAHFSTDGYYFPELGLGMGQRLVLG